MKDLKVGDELYEIHNYYGSVSILKVVITGETKTRWKVGNNIVLLKDDLSVYGNRYGSRSYQIELTESQKQHLINQGKVQKARSIYKKLELYMRDNIGFTDEFIEVAEKMLKD